jgi:dihydroorotate dehydrogenase (fumarate)
MVQINTIDITPPLLNSSCAWSSDLTQLKALYDSPYTGAITTRTATLNGFKENETHTVRLVNTCMPTSWISNLYHRLPLLALP